MAKNAALQIAIMDICASLYNILTITNSAVQVVHKQVLSREIRKKLHIPQTLQTSGYLSGSAITE